ncbi:hypothetical protein LCGC14_0798730 [marine sediment metagenome]|uniref:Replication protein n=1 Tax=marine sediment metagenome TaxID=412755 RepID=A0A0F9PQA3_9ZZZZ
MNAPTVQRGDFHNFDPDPQPSGELRRRLYTLRRELSVLQRDRVRACGFCKTGREVELVLDAHGKAQYRGTQHCSCVWECPVCQMLIKSRRRQEVETVVQEWGAECCVMLTLTIRHGAGDNLRMLRKDLQRAYAAFARGNPWLRFMHRQGVEESIRSMELTYSKRNGWHPHLHIVWFLRDELKPCDIFETDSGPRWWLPADELGHRGEIEWLRARWRTMVERFVGAKHVPNDHGLAFSPICYVDEHGELHSGEKYIQKLGLELADPGTKSGHRGSRTPLEIAWDYVTHRVPRDAALWRMYSRSMRGSKQITWSKGFKRRMGVHDTSDTEIVAELEEAQPTDRRLGVFTSELWESLRMRFVNGMPGPYYVLQCVTEGGPSVAAAAVAKVGRSTDVREKIRRTLAEPLLEWLPEWTGPPDDRHGPVRHRVCPGCGSTTEDGRSGCVDHRLCEPFSSQWSRYERGALWLESSLGERRCPDCKRWEDVAPSNHCRNNDHRTIHQQEKTG